MRLQRGGQDRSFSLSAREALAVTARRIYKISGPSGASRCLSGGKRAKRVIIHVPKDLPEFSRTHLTCLAFGQNRQSFHVLLLGNQRPRILVTFIFKLLKVSGLCGEVAENMIMSLPSSNPSKSSKPPRHKLATNRPRLRSVCFRSRLPPQHHPARWEAPPQDFNLCGPVNQDVHLSGRHGVWGGGR